MCGRITLKAPALQIAQEFALDEVEPLAPRYNIAPTQPVAVVVAGEDGRRRLRVMQWGLIPPWGRDPREGGRLFNARGETVTTRPAFREAFAHRRCLVVADGFYEWRREGRLRQPWYFAAADDRLLALAGVWSRWERPGGEAVASCSVLTTAANAAMRPIHDRMPVIVPPEARARWLETPPADAAALLPLLAPPPDDALRRHAVSPLVNRVTSEGPELIAPCAVPPSAQLGLF